MTTNLTLVAVAAVLVGAGVTLALERSLTRVLIGLVMISNGVNLMLIEAGGPAGKPPLSNLYPSGEMADPLPQALVLTAIVIGFAMTAFLVVLALRSQGEHYTDHVDGSDGADQGGKP